MVLLVNTRGCVKRRRRETTEAEGEPSLYIRARCLSAPLTLPSPSRSLPVPASSRAHSSQGSQAASYPYQVWVRFHLNRACRPAKPRLALTLLPRARASRSHIPVGCHAVTVPPSLRTSSGEGVWSWPVRPQSVKVEYRFPRVLQVFCRLPSGGVVADPLNEVL